jgi:hypothetical protein
MIPNRLHNQLPPYRLPQPQQPVPSSSGFILNPFSWWPSASLEQQQMQQRVYQIAWENAQAMTRPSLPERDLLAVWN